jgi:hypothetical protein
MEDEEEVVEEIQFEDLVDLFFVGYKTLLP